MRTSRFKPSDCLNCGKMCDAASSLDDRARPEPGDFTVCYYCRHLMVFTDDMTLRNLTDAEIAEAAGQPEVLAVMKALGDAT